jgi:hypothetical protein
MSEAAFKLGDEWQVGDECIVKDGTRVWKIVRFIGTRTGPRRIADLEPVGFEFDGTHSTYVYNLRTRP